MNTLQIYQEYMVPKNLQQHMLRVASLTKIILDNWNEPLLDKDEII